MSLDILVPPPPFNSPSDPSFRDWFYKLQQYIKSGLSPIVVLGTGILVKTGFNTFATREIEGTAGRVLVTDGDGISGNPTIDIDASFVGQVATQKDTIDLGNASTLNFNGSDISLVSTTLNILNTIKNSVAAGLTETISSGYQLLVYGNYTISGEVINSGDMVII